MKILSLRLKNLNSLKGEWFIDLRAPEFAGNGLFAITGWFRNRKLGLFRAFATAPRHSVVLRFDDRTLVISPEDPERFVRLMHDRYRLHD